MREMRHVVTLDGAAEPSELGGKASALDRLVAAGHPVPAAAVVTTSAYRAVVRTPPIAALLRRLGEGPDELPSDEQIDHVFLTAPIPREIGQAIDELGSSMHGPFAVRSSATAEDLSSSAFAGQYRTELGVEAAALESAVRLVWASLWHDAPRHYRAARHVDDRDPAMAVLVMELVDAAMAGVLFTRDPVGDEGDLRLETVVGSGDALVSGAVTPTAHAWPRAEAARRAAEELGRPFDELVDRALRVEAADRRPQDIEFAIDVSGRLWLLQARPITTAGRSSLTRAGIAEMLPGALPPLLQETAARYVDEGFRCLFSDLGGDVGNITTFVQIERSRAMLDLDELRRATATVRGGSVAELERGYEAAGGDSAPAAGRRTGLRQTSRILRRRRDAVLEAEIISQATDRLAGTGWLDAERLDDVELLALWHRVQDLGARATAAEMSVAALATAAYRGVEGTLERHVGVERAATLAQELTRHRRSDGPLSRCTRTLPPQPDRTDSRAAGWAAEAAVLGRRPEGRRFLEQWGAALARSGSRAVFGGPTWADEPELAWLAFTTPTQGAPPPARELHVTRAAGTRIPGLSRLRQRFLRREIADAAELLDRRERSKQALLDLGGIARRLGIEIGDRLARSGTIDSSDDLWLMTPSEVRDAVLQRQRPGDLGVRRRRFEDDQRATTTRPPSGGDRGWGASPGRAAGTAVVVDTPSAGAISRGDVLVARHTDAGWSPLIAIAGAIVVEEGGPLSHAAILAREFGTPAVVNLPGIVDRVLRAGSGVTVDVDGTTGTVTIEPTRSPVPVLSPPDESQPVGVFVTGLITASALFGAAVSITEAVSSARGARRTRARAAAPAAILARTVRAGSDVTGRAADGLAARPWYGLSAAAALTLAVAVAGVGIGEYSTAEAGMRVLGLAAAGSGALAALVAAGLTAAAWHGWPDVPAIVRRLTPPPRPHTSTRRFWSEMPRLHRRWLVVLTSTAATLLVLTVTVETQLRAIDQWIYDAIGAGPDIDRWGPEWFGMYFGRPQVVIPAALLVALFTVRCRILAIAYPLTIMFGGVLNLGIGALVGRARPALGAHAGQADSFPSGHAIEVTLLLGLAPLAIAILTRSRWVGLVARVAATAVLAVMLADGLREGSHWPSDHLGGFSIAMSAVVFVHALARMPHLHHSCTRCPALALLPPAGRPESGHHEVAPPSSAPLESEGASCPTRSP